MRAVLVNTVFYSSRTINVAIYRYDAGGLSGDSATSYSKRGLGPNVPRQYDFNLSARTRAVRTCAFKSIGTLLESQGSLLESWLQFPFLGLFVRRVVSK